MGATSKSPGQTRSPANSHRPARAAGGQRIRQVVADGHGGMWAIGEDIWTGPDQLSYLYHRTAKGAWTTRPMSADGLHPWASDLVRFPGTTKLVGVGSTTHLLEEYGHILVSR